MSASGGAAAEAEADAGLREHGDRAVISPSITADVVPFTEAAAALVVVETALETAAQEATESAVSPWQRSQRGLRNTLTPGAGRWR